MRRKIVAGNWKMNLSIAQGETLVKEVQKGLPVLASHQQVIFCAPFTHLSALGNILTASGKAGLHLGAQNCNPADAGAYTGEISVAMLKETGVDTVIVGHSERRMYYSESNLFLKEKTDTLLREHMQVLFCCGEPLEVRESNQQNAWVEKQLQESLFHLSPEEFSRGITIAYEPIWAIGTGKTASTEQAQAMHAFIRSLLVSVYGSEIAQNTPILYGGSCNAANAAELFACADVDGGLIGGASLKPETFLPIIQAMP